MSSIHNSHAHRQLPVRNPRTGIADHTIDVCDDAEMTGIVSNLRNHQPEWAAAGVAHRRKVLRSWIEHLYADKALLLEALATDTGRRLLAVTEINALQALVEGWSYLAEQVFQESAERPSATPGIGIKSQYVPNQIVGVISPWNFPLLLSTIDSIAALAAGCAVVIKPSEVTPRFIEPLAASINAIPELGNVMKLVTGDGETGQAMINHVDAICFTGSVATGQRVAEACATNFIPAYLELGGKDPAVVLPSANPRHAATIVLRASVQATGQACQSLERVYVHAPLLDQFISELVSQAENAQLNYPDINKGQLGPLIFDKQAEIIADHLSDAVAKGATILCGGTIENHGGLWLRPTVVTNVTHDMKLMTEETFGPVIPVMPYETLDEAVVLANDSDFGLSASVIGEDLEEAEFVARRIEVGAISINDGGLTTEVFDAGKNAFKLSGLGESRMGKSGITRFLREKALLFRKGTAKGLDSLDESQV